MVFYAADLHFGCANIIKFCSRPFEMVEAMNKALIRRTNKISIQKRDRNACDIEMK